MKFIKYLLVFVSICVIAGATVYWISKKDPKALHYIATSETGSSTLAEESSVEIGTTTLRVGIANSFETRAHGLSDTSSLAQDAGLLFIFENDQKWGIWMKNMNYPIDIIWLSASSTIVDVKTGATPGSYPETFFPKDNARYVLEVNAGVFKNSGAKIGDSVEIERN